MLIDPKVKPETFVCKDVTRDHLCHVWLDTDAQRLVATDGHRMIVTPVEVASGDTTGRVASAALIGARKLKLSGQAELTANGNHLLTNGATMPRPECDDRFPPWQQVIPKPGRDSRTIGVSAKYLASIFAAVGDECIRLTIGDALDPILAECKTALGTTTIVIMPMRLEPND